MKRALLIGLLVFLPQFAFAGSQTFTSSGTFTVPAYDSLTVTVNGAGGGGGGGGGGVQEWAYYQGGTGDTGSSGGSSSFATSVVGNGGGGGQGGTGRAFDSDGYYFGTTGSDGTGGSASGGNSNIAGAGAGGGAGGGADGGSGGGTGGAGGPGGRAVKTYSASALVPGTQITVIVAPGGAGGTGGWATGFAAPGLDGSSGSNGSVTITWTDPPPFQCSGSAEVFSTPGTYTRTVPTYSTMSVTVSGAGGGGGVSACSHFTPANGNAGTGSSFNSSVIGNGGGGGIGGPGAGGRGSGGSDGTPGTASGGDANTTGGGSGGGAGANANCVANGGAGGRGGQAVKTYTPATLSVGSSVGLVVGSGGAGGHTTTFGGAPVDGGTGQNGSVTITCSQNSAPAAPTISGPTSGFTNTTYTYTFHSTDPDSDTIRYAIDWNDNGTIDEYAPALGYVSSGTTGSTSHSWNSSNTQTFKVLAQDSLGNTSGWASYTVNMSPNPPTVLLTATPASINQGQSSTLTWSSSHANSCTGTNFSTGGATQNTSPGVSVSPAVTTTYTITCTGGGGTASDSEEVTVALCTPTYSCTNSTTRHSTCPLPSGTDTSCASGQACSVNSCEDTYSCLNTHTILNNHTGATTNCPAPLICSSGSPTCVTAPAVQVLGALEARPSLVLEGDTTFLFWNIENADASTCSVTGSDGTVVSEGAASSGADGVETGYIEVQTVFTLTCTGQDGELFTDSVTVNVVPLWLEF